MTIFDDCVPNANEIKLSWTLPEFLPYYYVQTTACRFLCDRRIYYLMEVMLDSYVSSSQITNLQPGSTCIINLIAAYNLASLDPGISLSAQTLSASTRLLTAGLREIRAITLHVHNNSF